MKLARIRKVGKKPAPPKKRQTLIERLILSPWDFSYTKALDISFAWTDTVRIHTNLVFSSKYSQIFKIEGVKDSYIDITVNMPSIAGLEGSLPDVYTEDYILYNRNSKLAVLEFFDIFQYRLNLIVYHFLKTNDLCSESLKLEQSQIGQAVINLSGYGSFEQFYASSHAFIPARLAVATHNLFWSATRSAAGLKTLIQGLFHHPVEIHEWQAKLQEVSVEEQTRIGSTNGKHNVLGISSLLDRKYWDISSAILIRIGPLKDLNFLPNDNKYTHFNQLIELIRMYTPTDIAVDLEIIIDKSMISGILLNRSHALHINAVFGNSPEDITLHYHL